MNIEEQIKKAKALVGKKVKWGSAESLIKSYKISFTIEEAQAERCDSYLVTEEISKNGLCVSLDSENGWCIPVSAAEESGSEAFQLSSGLKVELFEEHGYFSANGIGHKFTKEEIKKIYNSLFPPLRSGYEFKTVNRFIYCNKTRKYLTTKGNIVNNGAEGEIWFISCAEAAKALVKFNQDNYR